MIPNLQLKIMVNFNLTKNIGVFLEAENCLHKVVFTKGKKLLLIMDFITKDCDLLYNHYVGRCVKDSIWRKISSLYYKLRNSP